MTGAPCSTKRRGDARRVGRWGRPTPLEAPGHQTSRDRPARRSMLGMTCITPAPCAPTGVGPPPSPRSRRRWKLTGMLPEYSSASWKPRSENAAPSRRRSSSRSRSSSTLPSR